MECFLFCLKIARVVIALAKYYVYRFINANNEIIYIGKTNNIDNRISKQHFSHSGHLPRECYIETHRIEYAQFKSDNMMRIYEIYLIDKHKPLYNQEFNYKDDCMDIVLSDPVWLDYALTDDIRASIKPVQDEAYWIAKDLYDIESWHMCFAALGGGL